MKKTVALMISALLAAGTCAHANGAAIYKKKCASCHGMDGKGKTKMGKKLKCRDLSDPAVQAKISNAAIAKSITDGIAVKGKVVMKPTKGLSSADIAAVTKYVRSLNGK